MASDVCNISRYRLYVAFGCSVSREKGFCVIITFHQFFQESFRCIQGRITSLNGRAPSCLVWCWSWSYMQPYSIFRPRRHCAEIIAYKGIKIDKRWHVEAKQSVYNSWESS